ncbi:hypothetical protein F8M49_20955 [Rhodococcus zopfii]|uniref:Uncharacterized protein n=1 Tax=Rhodococcus zopfii TaxID=43772 RepID=A0ABU3WT58_9NOCA|nr:hypothetical protein [Rhodococcus zopfii]
MTPRCPTRAPPFFDALRDELDAHFASIPVDTTAVVIDAEIISVVDVHEDDDLDAHFATILVDSTPASDTTPEDTTSVHRNRAAWFLWLILASGVGIAAVIWLTHPDAVV